MSPPKNQDIVCYEIPDILIQAILMFQKNPALRSHQPVALRVNGTKLQISSALISQTYIQDLSRSSSLIGELALFQSVAYDMRNR